MTRFRLTRLDVSHVKLEDDQQETNRKSGLAYAAAFSLFTAVVAGLIAGWLMDRWLGTRPWLLVAGIVLGAVAGFYQFIRISSKLS
jgi:F0F1-type ATP synthase assembly protein I